MSKYDFLNILFAILTPSESILFNLAKVDLPMLNFDIAIWKPSGNVYINDLTKAKR